MQKECVLLHGWGMNQQVWQLVLDDIKQATSMPVRTLDLPGFGEAQPFSAQYSLATAAEQLASQLKDNSVLVGWSLGGLFSLYIATHFPEKVSKVILLSSTPFFTQTNEWPGIKPDVLKAFKQQLSENTSKTIDRFLAIQAMGSESAKQDVKQLKQLLRQTQPAQDEALNAGLDILLTQDLRAEFAKLNIPIHGIFGALDALVPVKAVAQMTQLNTDFTSHIIAKASHAPFISHKDEFLKLLKQFI